MPLDPLQIPSAEAPQKVLAPSSYKSATVPTGTAWRVVFVQSVFARASSGTSADVRESDRGERDSSLSGGRPPEIPENVAL